VVVSLWTTVATPGSHDELSRMVVMVGSFRPFRLLTAATALESTGGGIVVDGRPADRIPEQEVCEIWSVPRRLAVRLLSHAR
jgi:hypothetical protein